jgi:acyl carrier protein
MILMKNEIRLRVSRIIDEVIGDSINDKGVLSDQDKLGVILSESLQSLVYVTAIEDEFDIEIEDDQIDIDLFEDIEVTVEKIILLLSLKEA